MRYWPEFDGIRGIFLLVVVACHCGLPVPGGWLAVDMFFVLSGYLITMLLVIEQRRTRRLDLRRFYQGRLYRLAPALLIAVALAAPVMFLFPDDPMMGGFSPAEVLTAVIGYSGNWLNVVSQPALGPLKHTWTLSIEEQFYLLWPLAVIWFARRGWTVRRRMVWCAVATGVIVAARLALMLVVPVDHLWFATTSRADCILVGAFVAFLRVSRPADMDRALLPPWAGWVAVGSLLIASFTLPEYSPWVMAGGVTLIAVASAVVIVSVVGGSLLSRLLTLRLFVSLGRVSYGAYLYHFVVLYSIRRFLPEPGLYRWAIFVAVTAALTTASWFLIERPVMRLRARRSAAARTEQVRSVR